MGSEEVQSVVALNPWEFTQKQFMRKPCRRRQISGTVLDAPVRFPMMRALFPPP